MIEYLVIGIIWYQIIAHFGISAGLHRYWAHRLFKPNKLFKILSLYLCVLAGSRSPLRWIIAHRVHHDHCDTDKDPHSPIYKGLFDILTNNWRVELIAHNGLVKYCKDLYNEPILMFFHKYHLHILSISAALFLIISPWLLFSLILVPIMISFVGFGMINYLCHRRGKIRNLPWLNLITAGEGYHREHHSNETLLRYSKYDLTGYILEKVYT